MESANEPISKTKKKKQMNELQDLGMALTRLSHAALQKAALPAELYEAVREYGKITSNGALKRQSQYIGRLMRETDAAPIRAFLARINGENTAHNAFLQRVEQARSRLLENDGALTDFVAEYPHADTSALRTLIRNARKEQEQGKPPKHFRALYQELKAVMGQPENGDGGNDGTETDGPNG